MNSIDKALTKLKDFEPIDVLVNNAGHGYRAAIEEGEDPRIQQLYATNLFGPIKLIQKLLPHMRGERSGAIINISSTAWKTHKENVENDHQEPGDPIKAGQVIVDVIGKDNPPKTLLLGSDAVKFVDDQLTQKLKEIKDWQDISKETDF